MTKADRKHVALAFPVGLAHLRPMLDGILDFAREQANWSFLTVPEVPGLSVAALEHWSGDGVIATVETTEEIASATRLRIPIVSCAGAPEHVNVPRVRVDDEAVGRMAGEHLLACGLKQFAFYGTTNIHYSELRYRGFAHAVRPYTCSVHTHPQGELTLLLRDETEKLVAWLKELKPPFGLLACNDYRAVMAMDACKVVGWRIPDDVAIVGVDNNAAICPFSDPPLTSVVCDRRQIGNIAANMLDRLMRSETEVRKEIFVKPVKLMKRGSSDVGFFDNSYVTDAHRYIRTHIHEVFGAEQLVKVLGASRRCLEINFRQSEGCTPYKFLCRVRIEHAKQLLAESPELNLGDVARACGFRDLRRFRIIFQRIAGVTPAEYRRVTHSKHVGSQQGEIKNN